MTVQCTPRSYARVFRVRELARLDVYDARVVAAARAGVAILRDAAPKDTLSLSNAIHVYMRVRKPGTTSTLATIEIDAPHAAAVERGSRPHMPPVAPLIAWAARHGFANPKSAGWAIAIHIRDNGTRPTFFVRRSLPKLRDAIGRFMGVGFR